jgi:hypothetical protein
MIELSTAMQTVANMKRSARTPQRKEKTLRAVGAVIFITLLIIVAL